ncbi:hypothetical protein L6R50_05535 [Myxococcota bacterium]|nr:hypothetical protein [Myxococcota bacterium]
MSKSPWGLLVACASMAVPGAAWADVGIGVVLEASSVRADAGNAYAPWRILDEDRGTAWCEGKPDAGIGEGLVLTFPMEFGARAVRVQAGVHGSAAQRAANNRPTRLDVAVNDGAPVGVDVGPEGVAELKLPAAVSLRKLEVRLAGATATQANHSCIAGVEIDMTDAPAIANLWLAEDWEQRGDVEQAVYDAAAAFDRCDAAAIAKAVKLPLKVKPLAPGSKTVTHQKAATLASACADGLVPALPGPAGVADSLVRRTHTVAPGAILLHYAGTGRFRFAREGDPPVWRLVEVIGDPD